MNLLAEWRALIRQEFGGYSSAVFQRDFLSAMTVAAIALPLALAFGVASGATAAAGLVAAILAGIVIGLLGGAPLQISGPTGGMSAVLVVMASRYGLEGIWIIGLLAGLMLIVIGVFRFGRIVTFIPAPVIVGFTSGIAIIIAFGQIDNALGVPDPSSASIAAKLSQYAAEGIAPNWLAVVVTLLVLAIMIVWPRLPLAQQIPESLLAIVIATIVVFGAGWEVPIIGNIPRSIVLENRLRIGSLPWRDVGTLLLPALSVAALGTLQSLLVGAAITNMTGKRSNSSVELVAQGIANMLIPFFGGVVGTAAIARTSVNIKSGGTTRMVPILHGVILLLVALIFAPIIGRVPLAALAGVLLVTAWRMNNWVAIRFYFGRRIKHAMAAFLMTLLAIVLLDLNQAIALGIVLSMLIFVAQMSELGLEREHSAAETVYRVSGPLFFAAARTLIGRIETKDSAETHIVLSLADVSLLDTTGIEVLQELQQRQTKGGGSLVLKNVSGRTAEMLKRSYLDHLIEK